MGKGPWPRWLSRSRRPPRLLDLQGFRERVVAEVAKRSPAAEIDQFGDDGVWIAPTRDQPGFSLYVARFHGLYCQEPGDLDRLIDQLVRVPERTQRPATPESLRIMVRPDTYLASGSDEDARQICRHIAGPLWAVVALDEDDAIGFPASADLRADLAMDDAEIWNAAMTNTRPMFCCIERPAPHAVQIFAAEAGYISSCLADDELWFRLDNAGPDPLLVVPLEVNVLAVFGSFDSNSALAVRDLVAVSEASPDHLSSTALARRDGRWVEAAEVDAAFAPSRVKH